MELDITTKVNTFISGMQEQLDNKDRKKKTPAFKLLKSLADYHKAMPDMKEIRIYPHHEGIIVNAIGLADDPLYIDPCGNYKAPTMFYDEVLLKLVRE